MILAKLKKNSRYTLPDDDPKENIVYTVVKLSIKGIKTKSSKDNKITVTKWKDAMAIDVDKK